MTCLASGAKLAKTLFPCSASHPGGHRGRHHARTFDAGWVRNKAAMAAIHSNPTFDPLKSYERAIQSVIRQGSGCLGAAVRLKQPAGIDRLEFGG